MNFDNMKKLLDSMSGRFYPGIDMCIYREHKLIFRYQAGYSDVENRIAVNPDAQYFLFSCTKPITCVAALQLVEKGELLLTDNLSDYLPEFADVMVKEVKENGSIDLVKPKRPIQIRDLLTMTAGLNYNLEAQPLLETIGKEKCSTREIVSAIAKSPLDFHPGEKYQYSLCHDVLGAVIEVISGKTLGEYLHENIFEPCEMKNTGFKVTEGIKANMPPMYEYKGIGDFTRIKTHNPYIFGEASEYESGGAGLISCVDDYIKFADAMANDGVAANGNRILSKKTIDVMRTPFVKNEIFNMDIKKREGYGYGLGVRTFQYPENGGQFSNIGEFGWDGAANSYVLIDPSEKLSLFCGEHLFNGNNHDAPARFTNVLYTILSNENN